MIDFYYWPTPNGWKVSIMLEECGLDAQGIEASIHRRLEAKSPHDADSCGSDLNSHE